LNIDTQYMCVNIIIRSKRA